MSRLGDIFNLVGGGTPTTSIEEYWGNGTPWISSADIDHSGRIVYRRRVTPSGVANSTTSVVPRGTIIVVTRVGLGKVAQLTEDTCFSQDIQALLAKETAPAYSSRFLMYQLMFIMQTVKYNGRGTTISGITKKQLADVSLYFPPLSEQERIVARIEELFSQLDAGVETLKKTKAQLAVYRQAVLKEAFSSELSSKTVEIREIVDDIRIGPFGTMLHKSDYISGGVPVINPQHIKSGKILPSASVTVSEEKARDLSAYRLQTNDIIMGRRGEMGRAAAITDVENGWLCGTGSILFRLKPNFDAGFYAQILSSPNVVHYLEEHATGTTMKNLNEDIVQYIPVPFVTAEMQRDITMKMDCKMSVCDSIEQTVDTALQQAEAMRQSILKDAFEGKL